MKLMRYFYSITSKSHGKLVDFSTFDCGNQGFVHNAHQRVKTIFFLPQTVFNLLWQQYSTSANSQFVCVTKTGINVQTESLQGPFNNYCEWQREKNSHWTCIKVN